jgi:hypothetical protein
MCSMLRNNGTTIMMMMMRMMMKIALSQHTTRDHDGNKQKKISKSKIIHQLEEEIYM